MSQFKIIVASNGFIMYEENQIAKNVQTPLFVAESRTALVHHVSEWAKVQLERKEITSSGVGTDD